MWTAEDTGPNTSFSSSSLFLEKTLPKPPGAQQGISKKIRESKESCVSSAEPISTVHSPFPLSIHPPNSCRLAICSGLTLGSGENPMASKGIWYSHWPFLASQAVMPADLFSFGVLLLMFGCGDNATGNLCTLKNQNFVRNPPLLKSKFIRFSQLLFWEKVLKS